MGTVATGAAQRDGGGARRRVARAPFEVRLAHRAGRSVPGRAQRHRVRRDPRVERRGDPAPAGRQRHMSETGPLSGLRVVELASDQAAMAAKMLGDFGAEVVVVEPPGGHRTRSYGPFVNDAPDPERSLWWWYYNTSKLGVVVDIATAVGAAMFTKL